MNALSPSADSTAQTLATVSLTAGGLLLAEVVTAHAIREYHADKCNDDGDDGFCSADYDCSGHRDESNTARTLAIIGYCTAGAAVFTGVALLLIAPDDAPASTVQACFGPGRLRFLWSGTL